MPTDNDPASAGPPPKAEPSVTPPAATQPAATRTAANPPSGTAPGTTSSPVTASVATLSPVTLPPVTLHVCVTCRAGQPVADGQPTPGAQLAAALADAPDPIRVVPVECLSACDQGCAVALSGAGRWSYVYGRMTPADAADILAGARAYAATPDGLVPWRARPVQFRKQSLARIPPPEA